MAARTVSIRWSLLRNILLLVVLLSGSILAVTFVMARGTVRRLSADLVQRTEDMAESQLRGFFEPVTHQLLVASDWSRTGLLQCREPDCFNRVLPPVMERIPQISSVNTGDEEGTGVLVLRDPDGWRNREVRRTEWGARVRWTKLEPDLTPVRTWFEDLDYDPRRRPWYEGAVGVPDGEIHWTEPYTFKTTGDPGVTASVRTLSSEGRPFVLAYDVLLKDLSRFTSGLEVSTHGLVFVVTVESRVVGLPRDPRWSDPELKQAAILESAEKIGLPSVAEITRIGRMQSNGERSVFDFEVGGEKWWGGLRPFRLEGGPQLYIGVGVPESDLLGDVHRQRLLILLLTAVALAAAVVISMFLAGRYSRPLEDLARQSDRISNLDMEETRITPSNLAEVAQLKTAQERMRSALDSFARYTPTEIVRDLLRRGEAAKIGGRTEDLTILFTDIAGFTTISEGLAADDLTAHMAEYFDVMLGALREGDATIDKLIGDAIVAFWGAPNPVPEHPRRAVEAVLECEKRLAALNRRWVEEGKPALPTRYGLATGKVVVGNIGTPSRLHYTVLGDMVNLASRLEGANKHYGTHVLAEEGTVRRAGDHVLWRRVDRVAVKGRKGAVNVYELLGLKKKLVPEALKSARTYEEALAACHERRFDDALDLLHELDEEDPAVVRLLHLCRQLKSEPPPDDWDGVSHLSTK